MSRLSPMAGIINAGSHTHSKVVMAVFGKNVNENYENLHKLLKSLSYL